MDYLLQSKTGLFKYRRRVPDSLRDLLGKREWKKSFRTRHRPTALARYATYSLQVEREIKAANEMLGKEAARESSAGAFREAVSLAQSFGIHPDQVPTLSANATRAEIEAFPARVEEWELLMDQWHEIYPDTGPDGYMRPPEAGSVKEMLQKVVSGQIESSLRRSFTSQELGAYVRQLRNLPNEAIGLIGLVMVYTGCRTGEAAGLCSNDVVLTGASPHIKFRSNSLRGLNKKSLARSVPIAPPLLDVLKAYTAPTDNFFGKYGPVESHTNVSNQLSAVITRRMRVLDPKLVPYSSRHTFKDRGRSARLDASILDYMQGHVTANSSRVSESYGTGLPPEQLIEDLDRLLKTEEWGNND